MKLQDYFPFDLTIVGLNGIYHDTEDGYFLNSSCVLSEFQIIKPNQIFILQSFEEGSNNDISIVQLLDVFYHEGFANLYIKDMASQDTKIIRHCISKGYDSRDWKLIEINFFMDLLKNGYVFCGNDDG